MRLRAHLRSDGSLTIDAALHDDRLRAEIAIALRAAALAKLAEGYACLDAADRR